MKKVNEKYYEIYAAKTGEKVDKIADMAHKDRYFHADEALSAGLIDEII
ncbi:ATP-dependent Clp protease proteolytic subunit [Candidatus Peregrinibacteria bacterium]|nr:ATP-dependent Clp protease proteolytic subunit [Candidatus Peregrinibacteria bacterium]